MITIKPTCPHEKQITNPVTTAPLYTPSQIDQNRASLPALAATLDWMRTYLAKPHPHLGRNGSVCPYVPHSLQQETIWLTAIEQTDLRVEQIETIIREYRDFFLSLEPNSGSDVINKALLIVLPTVPLEQAVQRIDAVQAKLKPFYTDAGLMLGEFHRLNQTPGLWNEQFKPLRSPLPMLVMRHMVHSDLPFLIRATDSPERRLQFLSNYLHHLQPMLTPNQRQEAITAIEQAQAELIVKQKQLTPPTIGG